MKAKFSKKHFGNKHKFSKTFNWNNVKDSCSCMSNIKETNNSHASKITNESVAGDSFNSDKTLQTCDKASQKVQKRMCFTLISQDSNE